MSDQSDLSDHTLGDYASDSGASPSRSVSVIIPTRNRRSQVARLIARLLEDPGGHEVVVVDDSSDDGTFAMLVEWAAHERRVVPALNLGGGAAQARLEGALRATGDVLVLLDDDVMPQPGLVAAHTAHHVDTDDLLVVGYMPTVVPDPLPRGAFATLLYAKEYEQSTHAYATDPSRVLTALWMGNVSLSRRRFLEAHEPGNMPPFAYRHEDRILGLVLRELGVRGVFDRGIVALHVHERPLDAFLRDCYENGRGREAIHRLYPDVLPESSEELYLHGLPGPARVLVRATRHDVWRRTLLGALRGGIAVSGVLGIRGGEAQAARVARKVEQLHGARTLGPVT